MKILIAEDDLVSRTFLNKFLSKYGECDLVVDGLETIDAFLMSLRDNAPYQLICLDIMMPKLDGVRTLKAIRDLEKQYGIGAEQRVKIIMTTALAEAQMVHTAFEYGCEAYAAKPIDMKKLVEVMEKLGLIGEPHAEAAKPHRKSAQGDDKQENSTKKSGYFKSVRALPSHQLEVGMETGTKIRFDFRPHLNTARFGMLRDEPLFKSVRTDGDHLIFQGNSATPVKITASEFMDLVLVDRTR